jgi:flagellin
MASEGVAIAAENLQAAESRIRDADMAAEIVQYAKESILTQAGSAMLAQANTQTQSVLQLLNQA